MAEKLVLACSGSLGTSVMLHWIKEKHGYDAITLTGRRRERPSKAMRLKVAAKATTQARRSK